MIPGRNAKHKKLQQEEQCQNESTQDAEIRIVPPHDDAFLHGNRWGWMGQSDMQGMGPAGAPVRIAFFGTYKTTHWDKKFQVGKDLEKIKRFDVCFLRKLRRASAVRAQLLRSQNI